MTAFHVACKLGLTSIVKLMLNNAEDFKLDLAAEDNLGRTGLKLAQIRMNMNVVKLITKKLQIC